MQSNISTKSGSISSIRFQIWSHDSFGFRSDPMMVLASDLIPQGFGFRFYPTGFWFQILSHRVLVTDLILQGFGFRFDPTGFWFQIWSHRVLVSDLIPQCFWFQIWSHLALVSDLITQGFGSRFDPTGIWFQIWSHCGFGFRFDHTEFCLHKMNFSDETYYSSKDHQ